MPHSSSDEICATTRGNDEYVLNVWQDEPGRFMGEISVFRDFQPNSGIYTGEIIKHLQAPSIEEMKKRFLAVLDQIAPESGTSE